MTTTDAELNALRELLLNRNAQITTMSADIRELRNAVKTLFFAYETILEYAEADDTYFHGEDDTRMEQMIRARQIARALLYEESEK